MKGEADITTFFTIFAVAMLAGIWVLLMSIDSNLREIVNHLRTQNPQVRVSYLTKKARGGHT